VFVIFKLNLKYADFPQRGTTLPFPFPGFVIYTKT